MDGGKLLIPGTSLPVIERVFWREPGWQCHLDALCQAAHKWLIRFSELRELLFTCRAFLQRDARGRQVVSHPSPFVCSQPVHLGHGGGPQHLGQIDDGMTKSEPPPSRAPEQPKPMAPVVPALPAVEMPPAIPPIAPPPAAAPLEPLGAAGGQKPVPAALPSDAPPPAFPPDVPPSSTPAPSAEKPADTVTP